MATQVKVKVGKTVPINISEYCPVCTGHSVGFIWFNKLISTALKSSLTTITEENVGGNELRLARTDYYVRKTVIEKIADT